MTMTIPRITKEEAMENALEALANFLDIVDSSSGLRKMQQECWQISEDHGFHDVGRTFGDACMLIVSEVAEALEAYREGNDPATTFYKPSGPGSTLEKPVGIPSEIADVVIRCLDFAECYGFDLHTSIEEKMNYNRTRPYLHGKKL